MSVELLPQEPTELPDIGRAPTPVDELTGLPLLIEPHDEVPSLLADTRLNAARREAGRRDYIDRNHVHHPASSPELSNDAGRAVQSSRVQWVVRSEHREYHHAYSGPPLPHTTEQRFRTIVFNLANYVPRQALSFRGGSPHEITLSDEQITRMQTSGEIQALDQLKVRKFLQSCVLQNPVFDHIPVAVIDEFLTIRPETEDDRRRQEFLAHKLLALVIEPVTEPLYETYRQTRQDTMWLPDTAVSPRRIVHNQLVGRGKYQRARSIRKIGEVLSSKLAVYRELAPVA